MARPARPWFRLYVETVHDLKLRRQPADLRWVWVAVLASARQSPQPGYLLVSDRITMTMDDLAEVAAVNTETAQKAVDVFTEADMLEVVDGVMHVVNWDKRQFESDNRASSDDVPPPKDGSSVDGTTTEPTTPDTESESEENTSVDKLDGFDEFWSKYPARDGKKAEKAKAITAWKRLSKNKRELAMVGVEHYAASGWRAKDAFRWLRDGSWVDWQEPAQPEGQKPAEPVRGFR